MLFLYKLEIKETSQAHQEQISQGGYPGDFFQNHFISPIWLKLAGTIEPTN